jgi:hypothetical protein
MSVAVLFVIDCTGSMRWVHQSLKERLNEIVQQFAKERIPVFFGSMAFRDAPADPTTAFEHYGFPESDSPIDEMTVWLDNLKCKGGGNNQGESSAAGIVIGIQDSTWPNVQRRVVALFTDDGPHVPDQRVSDWKHFRQQLHTFDIDQLHIFTKVRCFERYSEAPDVGYETFFHPLQPELLEDEIRQFVRQSSSGLGGPGESSPKLRERKATSANPFDAPPTGSTPEDAPDGGSNPFDDY